MPAMTTRQQVRCVVAGLVAVALLLALSALAVDGLIALGLPWPTEPTA